MREQRQMVIQLMQTEQQRYDMLLRLPAERRQHARQLGRPPPRRAGRCRRQRQRSPARRPRAGRPPGRPSAVEARFGVVEGQVKVPGGDTSELYVYVENYRGPLVRGKAVEIKQENKQFIPRVAVVPIGTSVSFPNLDPIFHNVFSNSPRNGVRPGQLPGRRQDPLGGVQRARRRRHLLQHPPAHERPRAGGAQQALHPGAARRQLPHRGRARRRAHVVAWSPSLKPTQQKVEVGPGIASRVAFDMEYTDQKTHTNKMGHALRVVQRVSARGDQPMIGKLRIAIGVLLIVGAGAVGSGRLGPRRADAGARGQRQHGDPRRPGGGQRPHDGAGVPALAGQDGGRPRAAAGGPVLAGRRRHPRRSVRHRGLVAAVPRRGGRLAAGGRRRRGPPRAGRSGRPRSVGGGGRPPQPAGRRGGGGGRAAADAAPPPGWTSTSRATRWWCWPCRSSPRR